MFAHKPLAALAALAAITGLTVPAAASTGARIHYSRSNVNQAHSPQLLKLLRHLHRGHANQGGLRSSAGPAGDPHLQHRRAATGPVSQPIWQDHRHAHHGGFLLADGDRARFQRVVLVGEIRLAGQLTSFISIKEPSRPNARRGSGPNRYRDESSGSTPAFSEGASCVTARPTILGLADRRSGGSASGASAPSPAPKGQGSVRPVLGQRPPEVLVFNACFLHVGQRILTGQRPH